MRSKGGICIRVYTWVGGMKVCLIAKLRLSEGKREFYTISFEHYRASIRHLLCMNVLTYAYIYGPVSMRYR